MIAPGSPVTMLTELPRWVGWRTETRKGNKATKLPYQPGSHKLAATDKPETWGPYDAACTMKGCDGPGLVLTGLAEVAALDLDGCREPTSGRLTPWAQSLCERAQSYTEVTPSKRGLRIIGLAPGLPATTVVLPQGEGQQCEIYCGGTTRYVTVSWERLDEYPAELNDIGPLVRELLSIAEAGRRKPAAQPEPKPTPNGAT